MAQGVRMPELGWDAGRPRVELEQVADRSFGERFGTTTPAAKQVSARVGRTQLQIGAEEPLAASVERMPVRIAALEPPDPNLIVVDVRDLHERGFAAPQAVAVHEIEEEEVADILGRDLREEGLDLFAREELDRPLRRWSAPALRCVASSKTT